MSISSVRKMTKLDFKLARLYLSERSDHEIEINDSDVEGIVYLCIGSEYDWVGLNFKADITKSYTKGELWKDNYGTHCIDTPTVEIEKVSNITVSYDDSSVSDNETLDIDYTSRIDDIKKIISDFIYTQELTVESKHNAYNTYNV